MSRVENQRRLFLELVETLRPHWHRDTGQPRRLAEWLTQHRAGSRDRRLYRELAYTLWRILPWVEDAAAEILVARVANHAQRNKATADFIDAFADENVPDPGAPATLLPAWFREQCPAADTPSEINCLLSRAPLWIRQHGTETTPISEAFPLAEPSPYLPGAWRLPADTSVTQSAAFREGRCEVQDAGSQALLHCLPDLPTGRWLDACAGAGGKALQLADLLRQRSSDSKVLAHDIRPAALRQLTIRQRRAGLTNITITREPKGTFEGVLVDAPCSGSGTWRRSPHLKATTRLEDLRRHHDQQLHLLTQFAATVTAGGTLIYATCSLCRLENEDVVDAFLSAQSHFRPLSLRNPVSHEAVVDGKLTLLPSQLDSDGYFVAAFRRS